MPLIEKLAKVMQGIKTLHEDEKHSQGWTFASVGSMYNAVRPLLAENGVMIFPKMTEVEQKETGAKSSKGNPQISTTIKWNMLVTDGTDAMECPWQSNALDYDDKGINKAATTAMKYFIRTLFMISTSEDLDPDHDASGQQNKKPSNQARAQPAQPASQPQAQNVDEGITTNQVTALSIALKELQFSTSDEHKQQGREFISWLANIHPPVDSIKYLTKKEAQRALDRLGEGENGHYKTDKAKAEKELEKFVDWRSDLRRLDKSDTATFDNLGGKN
jgi:hypothetical protein